MLSFVGRGPCLALACRLYEMTDDAGMKDMLKYLIARDVMHQQQWLAVIEELGGYHAQLPIPNSFDHSHGGSRTVVHQAYNRRDAQLSQSCQPRIGPSPVALGQIARRHSFPQHGITYCSQAKRCDKVEIAFASVMSGFEQLVTLLGLDAHHRALDAAPQLQFAWRGMLDLIRRTVGPTVHLELHLRDGATAIFPAPRGHSAMQPAFPA